MKADEPAEAARKAARKRAKARSKAVVKANRKLSAELAGPPALRTMTAEGSATDMTRRRRCSGEEMATLSKFLSIICPSGTVCKHPLLPIAIGAIPATPHLTCGECRMSFCGFEVLKCPPFVGQDRSTAPKPRTAMALILHLETCPAMGTAGRPEGRWGASLIRYMKKGFSLMSPGQQDRLAPGLFDLCEAAHHVTVTEPLLRTGTGCSLLCHGGVPCPYGVWRSHHGLAGEPNDRLQLA